MIRVGSYAAAQRSGLTIVQTSVGTPKWLAPLPQLDAAKPYGIWGRGLAWDEYVDLYERRLADRWDRIERDLHWLTAEHGSIALCCWCRDPARCHRTILAGWLEAHGFGPVPEVEQPAHYSHTPTSGQLRLGDPADP
jgi:hypothetical protein